MKRLATIDIVTILGIAACLLLVLGVGGCVHSPSPTESAQCCKRLSLYEEEMDKFNRYCKVALFIHNSDLKDKKVKQIAQQGVRICKFVFKVETDQDLLSIRELNQGYHKVRHYIITNPSENGWRPVLDCDPIEPYCEEF